MIKFSFLKSNRATHKKENLSAASRTLEKPVAFLPSSLLALAPKKSKEHRFFGKNKKKTNPQEKRNRNSDKNVRRLAKQQQHKAASRLGSQSVVEKQPSLLFQSIHRTKPMGASSRCRRQPHKQRGADAPVSHFGQTLRFAKPVFVAQSAAANHSLASGRHRHHRRYVSRCDACLLRGRAPVLPSFGGGFPLKKSFKLIFVACRSAPPNSRRKCAV